VFPGSNNDGRVSSPKSGANEPAQVIEKELIFSVELNYVCGMIVVGPRHEWYQ
jgi:hypothetical protein